MKKTISYIIDHTAQNQKISQFLSLAGFSKKLVVKLKNQPNGIMVNQLPVFANHVLREGELLTVQWSEDASSEHIVPVSMDLDIVYEDEDLMVINKAAGLPIHPSMGNYENTLANGVAWYFQQKETPFVFRVINRLDRDTTGLLILAKHQLSSAILSSMVKKRQIHREYVAIVQGQTDDFGTVTAPIGRAADSVIERRVDILHGESACTHYRLIAYDSRLDCSFIGLKLETGRTHQIRVHMKHIGHPLLGDFLYYPDYRYIKRQALHSCRLEFCHPLTHEPLAFYAPLPQDMAFIPAKGSEVLWDNGF